MTSPKHFAKKRKLSARQREIAALTLHSVRSAMATGPHTSLLVYTVAGKQTGSQATEAALAGMVEDCNDLCIISDYFRAKANPGAYCNGFRF